MGIIYTIIMKVVLVCLLIITTAAAAPRIVGGKPINITDAPWQAQVNWWIWDFVFECGAAIIGPYTAVTAGHCVGGQWSRQIKMVSDSTKVDFGNWHDVIKYIRHPNYTEWNDETYDNDLAIVWVAQRFVDEDTIARAINISDLEPKSGDQALITGYGVALDNATEDTLHSIVVPIIAREECNETYEGKIGADKICGGLLEGDKGVCTRDDGGPVVVNGALVGIVSSRSLCFEEKRKPEVYTNIAFFREWIEEEQKLFEKEQKYKS